MTRRFQGGLAKATHVASGAEEGIEVRIHEKNALQNDLKQAYSNWYNQLPQDQKDELQSTLNQTS
jgi:hypothetical protein